MAGLLTKNKSVIDGGTFVRKHKRRRTRKWLHKEKPMTVCIAAIADALTNSPKIVFAADRLVSAGVCFESGVPKIKELTNYAYVMISSNDALVSDLIATKAQKIVFDHLEKKNKLTIEQIAELFSKECEMRLKQDKEKKVFSEYNLTSDEFKNKSKDLHDRIVQDIICKLYNYEYSLETLFLIIGIDSKPHIYTVDQGGDVRLWDSIGFATAGDGGYLAYPEITKFSYNPNSGLSGVLVRVYNSKKVAERVGGVGKETDLAVLWVAPDKDVALWVAPDKVKDLLDEDIEDMKQKEEEIIKKVESKLMDFFTTESNEQKK